MIPFLSQKTGWIGIDIGTHAIKLQQLERCGDRLRTGSHWVLPLEEDCRPYRPQDLVKTMAFLKSEWPDLQPMFHGRYAAVTLPMRLTPLGTFDVPDGPVEELRPILREELIAENDLGPRFGFDFWKTQSPREGMVNVATVTVDGELASTMAKALLELGLECQTLDTIPGALARAVAWADRSVADPVCTGSAALDLGQSNCTFVIGDGQRPRLCRNLPDCGLSSLYESFRNRLGLSERQRDVLLKDVGLSTEVPTRVATMTLGGGLEATVERLIYELQRTLNFAREHDSGCIPERLWLFGGGAAIAHLAERLMERLAIDVRVWGECISATSVDAGMFGSASALSAMGWEDWR